MDLSDLPNDSSLHVSARMLSEVLEGRTYGSVALEFGVTKTAVESRVKRLAQRLVREAGITGMNEPATSFVNRLRMQREAVMEALLRFEPSQRRRSAGRKVLTTEEIAQAAGRIKARSPQPLRDLALFYVLLSTGAWPLEVARLEVRDFLNEDGSIRSVSHVRTEASVTGRVRPLYFSSSRINAAVSDYLRERQERRYGASESKEFCGLAPTSRLFLTASGDPFEVTQYGPAGRSSLCQGLQQVYRNMFRWGGLRSVSPLYVRYTLVARLYARGADESHIGLILGINSRSAVRRMFPRPKPCLLELVADIL